MTRSLLSDAVDGFIMLQAPHPWTSPGKPGAGNGQCSKRCQKAVVTATFQKCGSFKSWMSVENWWPWKWPLAMQLYTYDWHPSNSRKASNSRDVGNSKDPSSNSKASFKQGQQRGEGTTSTTKTPARAGSVWNSYKSGRKWSLKYVCECGSDKKNWWRERSLKGVAAKAFKDLATLNPAQPQELPAQCRVQPAHYIYKDD